MEKLREEILIMQEELVKSGKYSISGFEEFYEDCSVENLIAIYNVFNALCRRLEK